MLMSFYVDVGIILGAFSANFASWGCRGVPWSIPGASRAPKGSRKEFGDRKSGSLDPPLGSIVVLSCGRGALFHIFGFLTKYYR